MKKHLKKMTKKQKMRNFKNAYVSHLATFKMLNKLERDRLKKIVEFSVGQEVTILYNKYERQEKVLKVCDKTYKVSLGDDDYVLINKDTKTGLPNSVLKNYTGDGRRFVGELCRLQLRKTI